MRRFGLATLVLVVAAAGCEPMLPQWEFTQTGPAAAPQDPGCDVRLYLDAPAGSYQELGVIDNARDATTAPTDATEFLAQTREIVCASGGNGVIATRAPVEGTDYCGTRTCSHSTWVAYVEGVVVKTPG